MSRQIFSCFCERLSGRQAFPRPVRSPLLSPGTSIPHESCTRRPQPAAPRWKGTCWSRQSLRTGQPEGLASPPRAPTSGARGPHGSPEGPLPSRPPPAAAKSPLPDTEGGIQAPRALWTPSQRLRRALDQARWREVGLRELEPLAPGCDGHVCAGAVRGGSGRGSGGCAGTSTAGCRGTRPAPPPPPPRSVWVRWQRQKLCPEQAAARRWPCGEPCLLPQPKQGAPTPEIRPPICHPYHRRFVPSGGLSSALFSRVSALQATLLPPRPVGHHRGCSARKRHPLNSSPLFIALPHLPAFTCPGTTLPLTAGVRPPFELPPPKSPQSQGEARAGDASEPSQRGWSCSVRRGRGAGQPPSPVPAASFGARVRARDPSSPRALGAVAAAGFPDWLLFL